MMSNIVYEIVQLSELREGQQGIIANISHHVFATRMLAMGIVPGKILSIKKRQPFGGAYLIEVENQCIGLRKKEAELILLKISI